MAAGRKRAAALAAALLAGGCAAGPVARCDVTRCPEDPQDARHTVTYADGSGNLYVLSGARLEYRPVTPETSSSGTYSGGAPFALTLTGSQRAELVRALAAGIDARGAQLQQRVMTSGQISIECAGETRRWILSSACAELREIEATLGRLAALARGGGP